MRQEWVGKRQSLRTSVQLRAQIRFDAHHPPIECTITDISATGARVTVSEPGDCPDDFDVFIPARSETKWAHVRWRQDKQLGVEFLKGRRSDATSGAAVILARIAALESRLEGSAPIEAPSDWSALADPLEKRVSALESQITERSIAAASTGSTPDECVAPPAEGPLLAAALARIVQAESRFADLENEISRQDAVLRDIALSLADLSKAIEGLNRSASAPPPAAEGEPGASGAPDARLEALEKRYGELRASLQGLILLISGKIMRQQRGEAG